MTTCAEFGCTREPMRSSVGNAYRYCEACTHRLAVGRVAPGDLRQVGGVLDLVVRRIELGLVHAEPDDRPFGARGWRSRRRLLSKRPAGCSERGEHSACAEKITTRESGLGHGNACTVEPH